MPAKKLPLSGLMGLVALVAIDVWAYRRIFDTIFVETGTGAMDIIMSLCALGLLPTSTLIVVMSTVMCVRVRRCGEAKPFLLGFFISGLIAALSFVFIWWLANGWLVETVVTPSAEVVEPFEGEWAEHLFLLLFAGFTSVPQFLMAAVGGLVFRRLGLSVRRSVSRPAPGAPDGAANSPNLALQRTRPAAAASGDATVTLGGPVR